MRTTSLFLVTVLFICLTWVNTVPAAEQATVFTLVNALDGKKPLQIHLLTHDRDIVAAFATGYNARSHAVDSTALRYDGTFLAGQAAVTLAPDFYMPTDGKPVSCVFQFADGKFSGRLGDRDATGKVTRATVAQPDAEAFARCRLRILGALRRLQQTKGVNWRYALDMNLAFPWPGTKAQLETIVPDYRAYSAVVTQCVLTRDGHQLRGEVVAMVDYGGQDGKVAAKKERHTFSLDCVVIGDTVGGTCEIRVGDIVVKERVFGSMNYTAPPAPSQSLATICLHDATKGAGPVVLSLSLSDKRLIHGFAWAPSENHQPHTVDASGLKLDGDKLTGSVRVTVVPDIYRKGDPFDMLCNLNARFEGYEVSGNFTSVDRGEKRNGPVTGELRPKTAPVVRDMNGLAACDLSLGFSLVNGTLPHQHAREESNHATVRIQFRDGKPIKTVVVNPRTGTDLDVTVEKVELQIDDDLVTGVVVFLLRSQIVQGGRYRFALCATVEGDKLNGYWRGTLDGDPILTKSSKLGGQLMGKEKDIN